MIGFTSSIFSGLASDNVLSVNIVTLGGIISDKNIHVLITFVPRTANG